MKHSQRIPVPLIFRPLLGLFISCIGLLMLGISLVVFLPVLLTAPLWMIFIPYVKVTYK